MLRTKEQQKTICSGCPLAKTANLIGDSCTIIIIKTLLEGPKRFGDLAEVLQGVSTRTLTNKLKLLESKTLITHSDLAYSLTPKGNSLSPIIIAMRTYGEKYL